MSGFGSSDCETIVIDTLDKLRTMSWDLFNKHILVKFDIEDIPSDLMMIIKSRGSWVERYDNYYQGSDK